MDGLTVPESLYVHRFFQAVGDALASRMVGRSTPSEDNLTFLLGELMDENTTARHVLKYSLQELNADLEGCGTGNRLEVTFETNEHTRRFEGEVSYADLGIVFERRVPMADYVRKGVLIQAKRLFRTKDKFSLRSAYESFDPIQLDNLKELVKRLKVGSAAYYLLYNPTADAFSEADRSEIVLQEARLLRETPPTHPELRFLFHEFWHEWRRLVRHRKLRGYAPWFPFTAWGGDATPSKEQLDRMRDAQQERLSSRPGLRVCGLRAIGGVLGRRKKPVLRAFYERLNETPRPWFDDDCLFESFADFMVLGIMACVSGSQDERLVAVAEGRRPDAKDVQPEEPLPERAAARHTLRVRLVSTLRVG